MIVGGNILCHRESKRGLTHRRTPGYNHQVAGLPARGDIVEFMIARSHTCKSVLIGSGSLNALDSLRDDGINLRIILLHVALTQLKERVLGLLHQFVDIVGLIKGLRLDDAGKGDELASEEFLSDDVGVVLDIS